MIFFPTKSATKQRNKLGRYSNPYEFDMALQEPIFAMMARGIKIDEERRTEYHQLFHDKWQEQQTLLDSMFGRAINVNSPKVVQHLLYDVLELPKRYMKKRPTANEAALRGIMSTCKDKLETSKTEASREKYLSGYLACMYILRGRGIRKRISSYIDADFDLDGRCRTTISVGGAETGRHSSSKTLWNTGMNLQTVPKLPSQGLPGLRRMFVADEGMELGMADLEAGESWFYSHLASEQTMMDILYNKKDFHVETALAINAAFDKTITLDEWRALPPQVQAVRRYLAKRANHALTYVMSHFKFAEVVNKDADETGITVVVSQTRLMREAWLQKYWSMPIWWDTVVQNLKENGGMITTSWGRKRQFFEQWGSEELKKEAVAYEPQSSSHDYLSVGIIDVWNDLDKKGLCEVLLDVHDELLFQYPIERRDEVLGEVKSRLERKVIVNNYEFTVPVEMQYGPSWGDKTKWSAS